MRLLCALGRHRPSSRVIPNEGRLFSRCTSCNADIIMVGNSWRTAPPGYRVIWKETPAPQPDAEQEEAAGGKEPADRRGKERRGGDRRKNKTAAADGPGVKERRSGDRRKTARRNASRKPKTKDS